MPSADEPMQAQLAEMARAVAQLQLAVLALTELVRRPAVHLSVEHMAVERLEFRIDQIDVDTLEGQMNVGLTANFKAGGGDDQQQGPVHAIWPASSGKGGERTGEPTKPAGGAGAGDDAGQSGG